MSQPDTQAALIANRGEIALRIIRGCRGLELVDAGVHSAGVGVDYLERWLQKQARNVA